MVLHITWSFPENWDDLNHFLELKKKKWTMFSRTYPFSVNINTNKVRRKLYLIIYTHYLLFKIYGQIWSECKILTQNHFSHVIWTVPLEFQADSWVARTVKSLPAMWETWVWSLGWEDPWRRAWQPTPAFLPGEFHRQMLQTVGSQSQTWMSNFHFQF